MTEPQPGPSGVVPLPPTKKIKLAVKQQLTMREKKILVNIYNHLEKTSPTYPKKMELYKATSEIMEVSVDVVRNVMKHYQETKEIPQPKEKSANRTKIANLDNFVLTAISRKIHQFYFNGELPTVEKVMMAVNNDDSLPVFSRTTMYRILKKFNFAYTKRSRKMNFVRQARFTDLKSEISYKNSGISKAK